MLAICRYKRIIDLKNNKLCKPKKVPAGLHSSARCYVPIISFSPSITNNNSSGFALPIFFPILSVDNVLIWLIFTQDRLGSFPDSSSNVSGYPAR